MFFGKLNNNDFGFSTSQKFFVSSVEISDEDYEQFQEALNNGEEIQSDKNGFPVIVKKRKSVNPQLRIDELEKYLLETDWYAIRFVDNGEKIPSDIQKKRQEAREEISELRERLQSDK